MFFVYSILEIIEFKEDEGEGYDVFFFLIFIGDDFLLESSLDEDESVESKGLFKKVEEKKKIYDVIFFDLLVEFLVGQRKRSEINKSQDFICEDGLINDYLMDFIDSYSEYSGNISNRYSYIEFIVCDDVVSFELKEEEIIEIYLRKRIFIVFSVSMELIGFDVEEIIIVFVMLQIIEINKGLGFKVKRRRKFVLVEAEQKFF